ncbi:MAG: DUF4340 domain-containing protein [Sumerlaeia bacterium]
MMTARRPVIAALVAALLFGLFLADRTVTRRAAQDAALAVRLMDFDESTATRVELTNTSGTYVLEKRGEDNWWLTEPREQRAETAQVRALIDNIRGAKKLSPFEVSDLAEYGLAEPLPTITIEGTSAGEPREVTVLLGDATPQIGRYYAKLASEDGIFTVNDWIRNQAEKDLAILRYKGIASFDPWEVNEVAVQSGGETVRLSRAEDGGRWLIEGSAVPADQDLAEAALQALASTRALRIDDAPTSTAAELGFESPLAQISVHDGDAQQEVTIGKKIGGEAELTVRSTDQPGLAIVRAAALGDFLRPAADWTSKGFLWSDIADVRRVTTQSGTAEMALLQDEEGNWSFEGMEDVPVRNVKLAEFLNALATVRARRVVAANATTAEEKARYGLTRPSLELRIETRDNLPDQGLLLGRSDPAEGIAYAQRIQDGAILALDFTDPSRLYRFRADLQDRRINPGFGGRVAHIEIANADREISVAREGGVWKLAAQGQLVASLPDARVAAFIGAAEDLEWTSQLQSGEELTPNIRFDFFDENGDRIAFLHVAEDAAGTEVYITPRGTFYSDDTNKVRLATALQELTRVQ